MHGDPSLLQQAFLNLALNACQAMPHGGRLRIVARGKAGQQLEVEFEDTGIGISPEHLSKIFDLYFTTKQHGSGIGLSLVYRTVQLHDGDIEVQSIPGRGTTFRVQLRQATKILAAAPAVFCVIIGTATMSSPLRAAVVLLSLSSLAGCSQGTGARAGRVADAGRTRARATSADPGAGGRGAGRNPDASRSAAGRRSAAAPEQHAGIPAVAARARQLLSR